MSGGELVVRAGRWAGCRCRWQLVSGGVRSAWVTVWVAEQVMEALGAKVATGRAGCSW